MFTEKDIQTMQRAAQAGLGEVTTSQGDHGIYYGHDDDGDKFASIGCNLPKPLYAEIEDGTYGQLQAVRIFL